LDLIFGGMVLNKGEYITIFSYAIHLFGYFIIETGYGKAQWGGV
jgi:hypothetical protein